MQSQQISPDIIDTYLVGLGPGSWPYWNSPDGAYVTYVSANDKAVGAVPMFTLYQMATNGEGNMTAVNDVAFMTTYWAQAKLMSRYVMPHLTQGQCVRSRHHTTSQQVIGRADRARASV